ncbi:MAG: hypothetical protein ABIJ30_00815, partial [bacterium]
MCGISLCGIFVVSLWYQGRHTGLPLRGIRADTQGLPLRGIRADTQGLPLRHIPLLGGVRGGFSLLEWEDRQVE